MPGFPPALMHFPSNIGLPPNMLVWLDAADAATIITGTGGVQQWNDKSGNGFNFVQGVSTKRPSAVTDGVQFSGGVGNSTNESTTPQLTCTISGGVFAADSHIFYVIDNSNKNVGADAMVMACTQNDSNYAGCGIRGNTTIIIFSRIGVTVGTQTMAADWSSGKRNCVLAQKTTTTASGLRVNNGAIVTGTTGTLNTANISIGQERIANGSFPAGPLNCIIREIVVYRRAMTNDEINQAFAYFTDKWGPFG